MSDEKKKSMIVFVLNDWSDYNKKRFPNLEKLGQVPDSAFEELHTRLQQMATEKLLSDDFREFWQADYLKVSLKEVRSQILEEFFEKYSL